MHPPVSQFSVMAFQALSAGLKKGLRGMFCIFFYGLLLFPFAVRALGPHEVALVYNSASIESKLLAQSYARLRGIPVQNLCAVDIAVDAESEQPPIAIPASEFITNIYQVVRGQLQERDVERQILAWVYSCAMPLRVICDQPQNKAFSALGSISLTGATFVRGDWRRLSTGPQGSALPRSLLFSAPLKGNEAGDVVTLAGPAESFDQSRNRFLQDMPLPSAVLAWTGARGLSLDEAMTFLESSVKGDFSAPEDGVFYITLTDDVRTASRRWEYQPLYEALAQRNCKVEFSKELPGADGPPLLGYMTGSANPPMTGLRFVPGAAFADHLTSFAGAFDQPSQVKCTEWLSQGAVFTAGTVCEPYAIWEKFPHTWVFVRLLQGLTQIEALYASIFSPLQILPMGDPLNRPWAPEFKVSIEPVEHVSGLRFRAVCAGMPDADPEVRYTWLLDGRIAGMDETFDLAAYGKISGGPHLLRLVVRRMRDGVRYQAWTEIEVFSAAKENR